MRVLVACPGPVATQFFADMKPSLEAKQMDQPRPVVTEILRAFENGKRVVYPGKITVRLSTWGARLMPRNLILRLAAGTVKRLNQKQRLLRKRLTATGLGKIDEVPGYNRACLGCSSRLPHQEFEFKSGQRRWNQCLSLLGSSAVTSR